MGLLFSPLPFTGETLSMGLLAGFHQWFLQTIASDVVQNAINICIKGYPDKSRVNMHRFRVRVPLSMAHVLKHEAHLISKAVEAFYD